MRNRRLQEVVCLAHDDTAYRRWSQVQNQSIWPLEPAFLASAPLGFRAGCTCILCTLFSSTLSLSALETWQSGRWRAWRRAGADGLQGVHGKAGVCLCTKQKRTQGGRTQICWSYKNRCHYKQISNIGEVFWSTEICYDLPQSWRLKKEVFLLSNPRVSEKTVQRQVVGSCFEPFRYTWPSSLLFVYVSHGTKTREHMGRAGGKK